MNWREKAVLFAGGALLVFTTGCSADAGTMPGGKDTNSGTGTNDGTNPTDGTQPGDGTNGPGADTQTEQRQAACMANMKLYKGFGDIELTADRSKGDIGADRARLKPYSALTGEFQRVTGSTPASLTSAAAAFGTAPDRWFFETSANAISLYTTYRAAFEAGLTIAGTDAKYATAPTDATAATECASFERKAWSRTPVSTEIQACVSAAMQDSLAETDPKRRWAYAFAAVLGATGFTTF